MDGKQSNNDILKKQRQIAARLGKAQGESKEKSAEGATAARQIRPSSFKRSSASSVLAAARLKASGGKKEPPTKVRKNVKATIATGTKKAETITGTSSLASLVQSAAKETPDDEGVGGDAPISPDDFWKNIREWSFVSDLYRQTQGVEDPDEEKAPPKPIPDTFISTRHYIMSWAPKCLAEARAQLLSEVMTDGVQSANGKGPLILVDVETTWKTGRKARGLHTDLMDTDACHVQLSTRESCRLQFHCHDICGLVPVDKKDMVERLLTGKRCDLAAAGLELSLSKFCMIGHSETQRKDLNGLILKVSKRKWVSFCDYFCV